MGSGEDGGPGGEAVFQSVGELPVGRLGIGQVLKFGLLWEGVGVQPVQKLQIHPQTAEAVLWRVQMEIGQPGNDQPVPEVL